MIPTQVLPADFVLARTIDLSKDRRAFVILNVVGMVLLLISAWCLIGLAVAVRPAVSSRVFSVSGSSLVSLLEPIAWMIGISLGGMVVHEAIHGLFFWAFTGSRPRFGFRGTYAFAAAPDWYIPRGRYLIVTLAPVVVMTVVGVAAVFVIADSLLLPLLFLISMNFSGSVGDMLVAIWLVWNRTSIFAQDYGTGVRFFRPA